MIVARKEIGSKIAQTLRWIVFIAAGPTMNLPIIMTLMTSFKTMADINTSPPPLIFSPTLDNYREVLTGGNTDLPGYILNSSSSRAAERCSPSRSPSRLPMPSCVMTSASRGCCR